MGDQNVQQKRVGELMKGDRLLISSIPGRPEIATVEDVFTYTRTGGQWAMVVYRFELDGFPLGEYWTADKLVDVHPAPDGGDEFDVRTTAVAEPKPDTLMQPLAPPLRHT